jgi:hypothetical protein
MGAGPRRKLGTAAEVIKGNGELSTGKLRPDAAHYSHHRADNQSIGKVIDDWERKFTKTVKSPKPVREAAFKYFDVASLQPCSTNGSE